MKTKMLFLIVISAIMLVAFTPKNEITKIAIGNPAILLAVSENVPDVFTQAGIDYLISQLEPRHPIQFDDILFLPWNSIVRQQPEYTGSTDIVKIHNSYAEYAKKNPEKVLEFIKKWHDYTWKKIEEKHGKETVEDLRRQLRSMEALIMKMSNAPDNKIAELQRASKEMEKMSEVIYNEEYSEKNYKKYKKSESDFCTKIRSIGINVPQTNPLLDSKVYIPRLMCRTANAPDSKFATAKQVAKTSLQLITAAK